MPKREIKKFLTIVENEKDTKKFIGLLKEFVIKNDKIYTVELRFQLGAGLFSRHEYYWDEDEKKLIDYSFVDDSHENWEEGEWLKSEQANRLRMGSSRVMGIRDEDGDELFNAEWK